MTDTSWDKDFAVDSIKARLLHQFPEINKVLFSLRFLGVIVLMLHPLLARYVGVGLAFTTTVVASAFLCITAWSSASALDKWIDDAYRRLIPNPTEEWRALKNVLFTSAKSLVLRDLSFFMISIALVLAISWLYQPHAINPTPNPQAQSPRTDTIGTPNPNNPIAEPAR